MPTRSTSATRRVPRPPAAMPLPAAPHFDTDGAASSGPTEPELRHALIERAAYFRAAARGFAPGHELDDWLVAEQEIDDRLFTGDLALS